MRRAVRVVTDVAAVDRAFDYEVPESFPPLGMGDRVRINFHNRSIRGWVVDDAPADDELALKPLTKWLGFGPPPSLLPLLSWAAWRWVSPLSRFLLAASPVRIYATLPTAPAKAPLAIPTESFAPGVWQLAPTVDPLPLVLSAYEATRDRAGSLIVLVPTEAWAQRLRGRLEQRGMAVAYGDDQWDRMRAGWPVIVGVRGTALAPTPRVCGAVVLDADDDAYRSEASPTWDATVLLHERVQRDGGLFWATSVLPSPLLLTLGELHDQRDVADHWPTITVVDRRNRDPHEGILAPETMAACQRALASTEEVAVVVVLQRLGSGRLFACRRCGELARCTTCSQPEQEVDGAFQCADAHERRENFCRSCGATNLKRVQSGVTTLARDVGAQLHHAVTELTAATPVGAPLERVVVGTEATLQRVRRCGVVVFVDFDQYLLAPRASARRQALSAVARAARLVGARSEARGSVVLQTRRDDDVLAALRTSDVRAIRDEERESAEVLGLPPYGALAEISGEGAASFVASLDATRVRVVERDGDFSIRATDSATLCDVLGAGVRGGGRLRLAVQ